MKLPDVVYVVKPDDINEELKYSLRSLRNVPHGNVVIAGHLPPWVKNVIHVPNEQPSRKLKYEKSTGNLVAACKSDEVSDDFILMNDDFFIMNPVDQIETFHRGDIDHIIARYNSSKHYGEGMKQTKALLVSLGINPVISYELHVPMMMNKANVLEMMKIKEEKAPEIYAFHKRTFYGNYFKCGGKQMQDVKIHKQGMFFSKRQTFISTQDHVFEQGEIGEFIRERFSDKSIYEN